MPRFSSRKKFRNEFSFLRPATVAMGRDPPAAAATDGAAPKRAKENALQRAKENAPSSIAPAINGVDSPMAQKPQNL